MDPIKYQEYMAYHKEGAVPKKLSAKQKHNFKVSASRFCVRDGMLYCGDRRVLCKTTALSVLKRFHVQRGHPKREAFETNADLLYFCPGMRAMCRRVVSDCSDCQDIRLCLGTPRYGGPMVHVTEKKRQKLREKIGIVLIEEVKLEK